MGWDDLICSRPVRLQEWPDASGGDDHGRANSAENAKTGPQHEAAAKYHKEKVESAKAHGRSDMEQAHSKAAAAHSKAASSLDKEGFSAKAKAESHQARMASMSANRTG